MPKKVLIVDDEPDILESVKGLVENAGYAAVAVDSGKKCLERLGKEKFDLVLLDVLMPIMTGRHVLEEIRKNPKLKKQMVAFLTVVQLSEPGKEIIGRLKPAEYFQKPIDPENFVKRLRKLLK